LKKRIVACVCALVLCFGLFSLPSSVQATNTPCFFAVNDTLLRLEGQYIPILVDGQYYVPYTALDSNVTGLKLGISPIYNGAQNTLTVYDRERVLTFDLTAGTCADESGKLSARAVTRNGRIYLPAQFICNYFGLTYSGRTTVYGPMVRIRNSSSVLDDKNFVGMAQMQMERLLQEWNKNQSTESVTPVTPGRNPTEIDKSAVRAYLAFRADQTDGMEELLTRLEYYEVHALFFFPVEEVAECEELVRQVIFRGHAVGFLVNGTDAGEIKGQVAKANQLLSQIAHMNVYTVLAADVTAEKELEAIEAGGLLCWRTDLSAIPDGQSAFDQAKSVLTNADRYQEKVYILSDASVAGATLFGRLLPELDRAGYSLRLAVETEI